jgi:hypothetical protein
MKLPQIAQQRLVEKVTQGRDFTCMTETVNAIEAWLGSLPGRVPTIATTDHGKMDGKGAHMDGAHTVERSSEVTEQVLRAVSISWSPTG